MASETINDTAKVTGDSSQSTLTPFFYNDKVGDSGYNSYQGVTDN